jgi:hypothetical protein
METTNVQLTAPAVHGWLSGQRGIVIALAVAAAAVAIAAGRHWLAIADLVPLLFVLPCAVMMLKCITGTNRGPQTGTTQAAAPSDTPTAIRYTELTQPSTNPKEEDMTRKLTTLLAATAILGGLTTMTTAFAEESRPSSPPPRAQGMMGGHGGMMGMMGQMRTDQMQQMTRMADDCNRMMESMNNAPTRSDNQKAPDTHE